jgi:hypothetical protein
MDARAQGVHYTISKQPIKGSYFEGIERKKTSLSSFLGLIDPRASLPCY